MRENYLAEAFRDMDVLDEDVLALDIDVITPRSQVIEFLPHSNDFLKGLR